MNNRCDIDFKKPYYDDTEAENAENALRGKDFLSLARAHLSRIYGDNIYLTSSGSAAMQLAFAALKFPRGNEVILPSFTFPSAVNAALGAGLSPVFADINPDTMSLDIDDVRCKMTPDTACVMPVHYGGASLDLDALKGHIGSVPLIEDAALSFGASYKNKPLGTIGDMGIISFHSTKNISSDEGGMLIVNSGDAALRQRIQTIYDNGTDKQAYLSGGVSAYTWQAAGMNVQMPNMCAAVLCAQLDKADIIAARRRAVYNAYYNALSQTDGITLPRIPDWNTNNHHVFYVLLHDEAVRDAVMRRLNGAGIGARFHYMPLHASAMGRRLGYAQGDLPVTMDISRRLLRLPLHAHMRPEDALYVADALKEALCPR